MLVLNRCVISDLLEVCRDHGVEFHGDPGFVESSGELGQGVGGELILGQLHALLADTLHHLLHSDDIALAPAGRVPVPLVQVGFHLLHGALGSCKGLRDCEKTYWLPARKASARQSAALMVGVK